MKTLRKVLVVDDDPVVGKSFDRVLTGKGYAVITAASAQEALKKLETENYDVVFTDIKMPGMSGLEMAEQVKAKRPWLPVVIITGYGSPENEARAEAAGVSGFLRKPLSPEMIEGSAQQAFAETGAKLAEPVAQPAAEVEPVAPRGAVRIIRNVALFLAAPFVGLAYILAFPVVGLGMLAWTAFQAQKAKAEAAAPAKPSALKTAALVLAAPFIGLAFVVAGPILGLGMLLWFGFQAWSKLGAKALADRAEAE